MRVNRAKLVRKYLRFYRLVYNICPPYQILLDGNFIYAALKNNINILERLEKLLQGELVILSILKSALEELKSIGDKGESAVQFALRKCTVIDDSQSNGSTPFDKMVAYLGNWRYNCFIITQ